MVYVNLYLWRKWVLLVDLILRKERTNPILIFTRQGMRYRGSTRSLDKSCYLKVWLGDAYGVNLLLN